jgi:hypothetical protein
MKTRLGLVMFLALLFGPVASAEVHVGDPVTYGGWVLSIGNSEYESVRNLKFSVPDALRMTERLVERPFFDEEGLSQLANASFLEILSAFHEVEVGLALQREADPDMRQVVVVYYSGHGVTIERDTCWLGAIVPSDAKLDALASTVLDEVLLNALLSRLSPAHVVVILDCGNMGARSLAAPGRLVLAASSEDGFATEDPELGHGVFTHYFCEGLVAGDADGDGCVSFQEAFAFAAAATESHADQSLGREQHPEMSDGIGEPVF